MQSRIFTRLIFAFLLALAAFPTRGAAQQKAEAPAPAAPAPAASAPSASAPSASAPSAPAPSVPALSAPAPSAPAPAPSPALAPSRSPAPAPAPAGAGGEKRADLYYPKDTIPLSVIVDDFTEQTGAKIQLRGKSTAVKTAFTGNQLTAEAFLGAISDANKLKWRKVKEGYELWDLDTYTQQVLPSLVQQKVFIPVHISAKYLFDAIKQSNVLTEKIGNVALDERTNKVIVSDLPEKLALVQDMVNLLDEPQVTRIFRIRYADIQDIVKKIEEFKSEAGAIEFDEMNHLIIVRDVFSNIQRMEVIIDLLDARQPRRVYNLNTIGYEGKDLDKLMENLKLIITPDAFFVIDDSRGLLILEDTPEVHEDVEKFLQVFDRPMDQVRIDAELLDVDQNTVLDTRGTAFSFSEDLVSAVADNLVGNFATGATAAVGNPFGFINYRNEFPVVSVGGGGFAINYLNSRIKAQLTAALTDNNTRVLLQPRVIVKNREEVTLGAEKETAITQLIPLYAGVGGANYTVTPSSVPSGLTVTLKPTISPTGLIEMVIEIENSSATPVDLPTGDGTRTITGVDRTVDRIKTILIIPDGETRVISGLIDRREGEFKTGVPFLAQIPIIGPLLFGTKLDQDRTRNLLFFVTPTIIREHAKGSVVAYEFDELAAKNTWETSSIEAKPLPRIEEGGFPEQPEIESLTAPKPEFEVMGLPALEGAVTSPAATTGAATTGPAPSGPVTTGPAPTSAAPAAATSTAMTSAAATGVATTSTAAPTTAAPSGPARPLYPPTPGEFKPAAEGAITSPAITTGIAPTGPAPTAARRFYAPTPEEFKPAGEGGVTSPGAPKPGASATPAPNTPEGLLQALREGGGTLPVFDGDRKTGWSTIPKAPEGKKPPEKPTPGVTPPRPAARPGVTPPPAVAAGGPPGAAPATETPPPSETPTPGTLPVGQIPRGPLEPGTGISPIHTPAPPRPETSY